MSRRGHRHPARDEGNGWGEWVNLEKFSYCVHMFNKA